MMMVGKQYSEKMFTDLNCIWMISNLIGVKLCDKRFECDSCPLDIIMRNLTDSDSKKITNKLELCDTAFLDRIIDGISAADYQSNIIYLANSWILKHLYANIYYLGINPIVTPLLDDLTGIKEYMKRVYFIKGQKLLVMEGAWGKISLAVPMNFLLLDKLNWTPEEINANKWIALIVVNQNEIQDAAISADQWKNDKAKLTGLFREYKESCLLISSYNGDKGKKLNKFYQLIGSSEYIKLLNDIFND